MKKLIITTLLCLFSTTSVLGAIPDYSQVQSAALYLYDANMCGGSVDKNSLTDWRNNCHLADAEIPLNNTDLTADFINNYKNILDSDGNGKIDVSGGFHDAGDFVKFGLPQMYTAVTLQWALYEYGDVFDGNGDKAHFETILSQFTEYIKKCTFLSNNGEVIAFCYQVGEGQSDHNYWGAPEVQTTERRAFFATASKPATDITSLAAAALAADYVNNKNADSLKYAKALYSFTYNNQIKAVGDDHAPSNDQYYKSGSYEDDISLAAAWLYIATGESSYLSAAEEYLKQGIYDAPYWIYCWDNTWLGSIILIAEKTDNADYWNSVKQTLDIWKTSYNTPEGYACINEWGSARYNANAQFIALLYSKYKGDMTYAQWAKSQMDYLLGNNKANKCYVTGISENSVKYPHHAAASGLSDANDKAAHLHTLYGALVGGPGPNDEHIDETSDYKYNEVALDYNAGFAGACAGLNALYGEYTKTENTTAAIEKVLQPTPVNEKYEILQIIAEHVKQMLK